MLKFKYRWLYALAISFLIMLLGFFHIIKSELNDLNVLRMTKINLQQEKEKNKTNLSQAIQFPSLDKRKIQTFYLTDIAILAHRSGVTIKSIRFLTSFERNAIAQLCIQGNYKQIISFILLLRTHSYLLAMLDFTFEFVFTNQYRLKMNLFLSKNNKNKIANANNELVQLQNPFCDFNALKQINYLNLIPLTQFKMLGYLKEDKKSQALVKLPNGFVITIKLGDTIGKERGKIIDIMPNYLKIALLNGSQHLLYLMENK